MMKFSELLECPFCGHDEFYTKQRVNGTICYAERFDGKETNNTEMYESLNYVEPSERAYCRMCNRFIGDKETDALSKSAEIALREVSR